jgi:hypothetical protein
LSGDELGGLYWWGIFGEKRVILGERMILGKRVIFTNLKTNFELGCRSINWCRSMIIVGWIFGEKGDFWGKGEGKG